MPVEPTAATTRRGTLVTFEGIDGCGKSTQAELVARVLEDAGVPLVRLREPGGTAISEGIRAVLLDPSNAEMCDECELLLYEASRAQLVRQVIEPTLAADMLVVCDRFYDSTYAYQAGGRGLAPDLVARANALGSCGLVPDLTVVLDLDPPRFACPCHQGRCRSARGEGLAFSSFSVACARPICDLPRQSLHASASWTLRVPWTRSTRVWSTSSPRSCLR